MSSVTHPNGRSAAGIDPALLFRTERTSPRISPDGRRLAYLREGEAGLHLEVSDLDLNSARQIGTQPMGPLQTFAWADDDHLLFSQDRDGDENFRLTVCDVRNGATRLLTPVDGVQARLLDVRGARALVMMNRDDPTRQDAFHIDVASGTVTAAAENPGFARWLHGPDLHVHGGVRPLDDGGIAIEVRDGSGWRRLLEIGPDDVGPGDLLGGPLSRPISLSADGESLFIATSHEADTVRLLEVRVEDASTRIVATDDTHDLGGKYVFPATFTSPVLFDPASGRPQLAAFAGERLRHTVIDHDLQRDVAKLEQLDPGDLFIENRTRDGGTWIVGFDHDDAPVSHWLYSRATGQARKLFDDQPELAAVELAATEAFSFTARDGLEINGYLTFPAGRHRSDLPAVVTPHGGPWARDWWGYNPSVQFLASLGFLVIQVNFRGSTGYGKRFVNAGDREWGGRMQDDLSDAVAWSVARGFSDRGRIAIMGGSYGGYAALAGAAFTPELYSAVVAGAAPANLVTFIEAFPPYWGAISAMFRRRVGDPEHDRQFLLSRSPSEHLDAIRAPVLLLHGANDPRVNVAEAERMATGLAARGVPHRLVVFPDEGHDITKRANRLRYLEEVGGFLASHVAAIG